MMIIILNTLFGKNSLMGYGGTIVSYLAGLWQNIEWLQVLSGIGGLVVLALSIYKLYVEIQNKKKEDIRDEELQEKQLELLNQQIEKGKIDIENMKPVDTATTEKLKVLQATTENTLTKK